MNIKLKKHTVKKKTTKPQQSVKGFQTAKVQKFPRLLYAFKPMFIYLDSKYHQKKYFSIYAYIDHQQLDKIAGVGLFFFCCAVVFFGFVGLLL